MSQHSLTANELKFLQEALNSDYKAVSIRLREGEYQYEISKIIANFQLDLYFPNVKNLIEKLHSEEETKDVQLVRKIQTILKKMEKSGVIKILPKAKPWELQRYALVSLKFIDTDKNQVSFATEERIRQPREKLKLIINQQKAQKFVTGLTKLEICILTFVTILFYAIIVWNLLQPSISPLVVIIAFSLATLFSIMLGKTLSRI